MSNARIARIWLTITGLLSLAGAISLGIGVAIRDDAAQNLHADGLAAGIFGAVFLAIWFIRGAIE